MDDLESLTKRVAALETQMSPTLRASVYGHIVFLRLKASGQIHFDEKTLDAMEKMDANLRIALHALGVPETDNAS